MASEQEEVMRRHCPKVAHEKSTLAPYSLRKRTKRKGRTLIRLDNIRHIDMTLFFFDQVLYHVSLSRIFTCLTIKSACTGHHLAGSTFVF